jgi:small subunit ribosomal protein S19e
MPVIYDVLPDELIWEVSQKLKDKKNNPGVEPIVPPKDSIHWKTAFIREFPPVDCENFWYVRAASIMRKLYRGSLGVNRLKKAYGGRSTNHMHLKHFETGSGAIVRRILQQLEKANLVKTTEKNGRVLTNTGRSLLDKTASEILRKEGKQA